MNLKEKKSRRQETNFEILKEIEKLVIKYPQQRFGQILSNYVLPKGDPFYEESEYTLERLYDANKNSKQASNAWKMIYRFMDNVKIKMDSDLKRCNGNISINDVDEAMSYIQEGIREILKNTMNEQSN